MSGTEIVERAGAEGRVVRVDDAAVREYLGFVLASEHYALPLSCVREILRVPTITHVPRAPHDVLGIVSVRGQVTTLVDLRRRLSLPCAELSLKARVLLVDHAGETIGLLCDRVLEVYRLSDHEVELASVLGLQASSHVVGIGRPGKAAAKGGAAKRKAKANAAGAQADALLILLDPVALLKRVGHG